MKYELLKRTAIALFVGSVISTYSVAEGSISTKSSLEDVTNAINKNGENISKVKKDISDLAKSLKGDDQNPGLLDALEEANKGLNENKEALALKADKEDVNKIKQHVSTLAKTLQGEGDNPGLLGALEEANKGLKENKEALALKADKADVDAIDAEVEVIGKNVKTIDQDLDTTIKDVKSLQGDMDKASKAVNSLSDNLKELNDTQNTLNESFKDQLNAANEALDKHESDIKEIKNLKGYDSLTQVEALVSGKADNQALEDLKKEVKDKEEGIGELSGIVNELGEDVGDLTKEHRDLEGKHNDLVKDVKAFNDDYNQFTDAVHAELNKKADVDDVEDALSRKANASDVYSKTETDSKFVLKADNSVVNTQAAHITKLRTDVDTHAKRLDHLDNRVNKLDKDLKRGLAAQAALTGLFQPYTVGKANFTAAVGGYKSQTAVAVGTGYRYNQNIATKAGVAFTQGGGVTYNAGVNFEW